MLFLPSTPTEFSLWLGCALLHDSGQVPAHPVSLFALHHFFVQCIMQALHFLFAKLTRTANRMMAHFPPKFVLNTHSHTYRGLCFRLVYTSPGSCFSEGGSEGFDEAQLCRNKIGIPSHAALSIFSQYLAQKESVQCVITVLWMDHLRFLLQVKNKSANKGRGT